MSSAQLRNADARRRQAMIEADQNVLEELLANELTWTHSSGATESKSQFIAAIASGNVVYETLDIEDDQIRQFGDVLIHNGILRGRASRDGQLKGLNAKFLAVWRGREEKLELVAWQSTSFSD